MNDLTIVIPATRDREDMLEFTRDSINESLREHQPKVLVTMETHGEFPFGELLNRAVFYSNTTYTCMTIADTIWTPSLMRGVYRAIEEANGKGILRGATRLNKAPNGELKLYYPSITVPVLNCFLFRTEDWRAIGGMNPWFDGWGGYEVDFMVRLRKYGVVDISILCECCFHLDHPMVENMEEQARNIEIAKTSRWTGKEWQRT